LLNKRLVVAGLDVGLIRQEPGAGPPVRDDSTGWPVMDATVVYRANAVS
jgi:hypothetical protein